MERKRPTHTFVVPAFRESPYLEACIVSLKKQSERSEVLVVTSTPSEFISSVCRRNGVPLAVNHKGGGIAGDWTYAYERAGTDYVTLAHQDDVYLPDYARMCIDTAVNAAGNDALIVFTGYRELERERVRFPGAHLCIKRILLFPFVFKRGIFSRYLKRAMLSFGSPIQCSSVTFHKSRIGPFAFTPGLQCNIDWDAWLRLAERDGAFVFADRVLMYHRIHSGSQTSQQIKLRVRQVEDKEFFLRLWPKPAALLLLKLYSFAMIFNRTSERNA